MFADAWLSSWLAEMSADLRGNGSALEVVLHDYALYKSTFTLLYFTLLVKSQYRGAENAGQDITGQDNDGQRSTMPE